MFLELSMLDTLRDKDRSEIIYENFNKFWLKYKGISSQPLYRAMFSSKKGKIFLCLFL